MTLRGSHITSPYSNNILTKYIFSKDNLSGLNFSIRRKFNMENAMHICLSLVQWAMVMKFNTTFNNISVISWWSV